MRHTFRLVQGNPCGILLAPYVAILAADARATVNSIYRGTDAQRLLNAHGKASQAQLYARYLAGAGAPANQPGYSTHEQRSDGAAYPGIPRGRALAWWQVGFDVNDTDVLRVIETARSYGWHVRQPYPAGSEFHHLNFAAPPRPGRRTAARILRLRLTLPRR